MATDIVSQIRPQGAYSSIVLMLVRAVKGDKVEGWKLNRATQNTNGVCVEVCYKKPREAETCLDGAFWNAIQSYLPTARIEHVFTAPDFFLELGGLTLSCLRVTGTVASNGLQKVMLVFRKAYGALAGLLKPRCAPDLVRETNCDLATRVLADIIVPAINLVDVQGAGRDADAKTRLAACLERISDNRHDLEFYAALLCRYVAQSQAAGHISRHPSARFGQQFLGYADAQLG